MAWDPAAIAQYDAVLIATDHDAVDYAALVEAAPLVIDTRNAGGKAGIVNEKVVRAQDARLGLRLAPQAVRRSPPTCNVTGASASNAGLAK